MDETNHPSSLEYLDFDLEIGSGDGRVYPVSVLDSPSGEARSNMQWPYDQIKLRLHLVELENVLLRSATTHRVASTEAEQTVEDFGSTLFKALFTDEVRNRYEVSLERARMQGKGLRIKLHILAPELAAIPWEFLYDLNRNEYLCFSRQTPIVRYPALPIPVEPMEVTPPLRILGMVASPRGLAELDVRTEKERLSQPLEKLQKAGLVELQWLEGQTWRDLQRAMRQGPWHIFHFIGHGGFDAQREEGFFAFCDEQGERADIRATQLTRLIADHPSLRLVVLNACEGGRSSQDDVFSSSASILLRGGVPAVLAMQYAITDRAALEFARTFYEALADGVPVDTAVAEGRLSISLAFADSMEWGTPVLYLRAENGVLFDVRKSSLPAHTLEEQPLQPEIMKTAPKDALKEEPSQRAGQPDQVTKTFPVYQRLLKIDKIWWIAGGIGLISLCFLLMIGSGVKSAALALLIPKPSATLTTTSTIPLTITQAQNKSSETFVVEQTAASTVTQTATVIDETSTLPVPSQIATLTPQPEIPPTETPANSQAINIQPGATQISPKDGMVMVYIPEGEFQMGCDPEHNGGYPCGGDETLHSVYLDAYWIDQTKVTNAMYQKCDEADACDPPYLPSSKTRNSYYNNPEYADYPVVYVTWDQAMAYCSWVGRRLPTEAEWEKAGRGVSDTRAYPWGDQLPTCEVANFQGGSLCIGDTSKEGIYPTGASPYGVLDMAGNVWDWVSDYYQYDYYKNPPPWINPKGPEQVTLQRVVRGACYVNNGNQLRIANRNSFEPDVKYYDVGFRCAFPP